MCSRQMARTGPERQDLTYDVAIIGASTSGLYAAELLASAGRRVGVFERRPNLEAARRTLIVTPGFQRVVDVPEEAILHRLTYLDLRAGEQETRVELRDPDLIVERSFLIRHWAARAEKAGADLNLGMSLESIRGTESGAELLFSGDGSDDRRVHALNVIGADGAASTVAQSSGMRLAPRVPLMQAEVRLPDGWDPRVTEVWFDDTTRFFYWLIPESDTHGVVGLAAGSGDPIRPTLETTLERMGLEALDYQSAQIALYHPRLKRQTKLGNASIFLVGDAAGDVKVSTVGGTVTGLRAAEAVSEHILTGKSLGSLTRGLQWELRLHWYVRFLLERLDTDGYEQLVENVNPAMIDLLAGNDRDRLHLWAWKLPFKQPRLMAVPLYRRS